MMQLPEQFQSHLESGATTLCRAWAVTRTDGDVYGFTDHDMTLSFDGVTFRADTGLSAAAIQQGTGLAVDNTEAVGVLSDATLSEDDIQAGRFDGAEVLSWLVNWANVDDRILLFRGSLGEIKRANGAFEAELRGLTEELNQAVGRVYQSPCSAVLGDGGCKFDLDQAGYALEGAVEIVEGRKVFRFSDMAEFADRWFEGGRLKMLSGGAEGLVGLIKNDRLSDAGRVVELWETMRAEIAVGDVIRLEAGCDKRAATCKLKFGNFVNFQGFPHIPGEDWLMGYPSDGMLLDGGSLFK